MNPTLSFNLEAGKIQYANYVINNKIYRNKIHFIPYKCE